MLGYRALVASIPHSTSAVALKDCTVYLISWWAFGQQLSVNPGFNNSLLQLLAAALGGHWPKASVGQPNKASK